MAKYNYSKYTSIINYTYGTELVSEERTTYDGAIYGNTSYSISSSGTFALTGTSSYAMPGSSTKLYIISGAHLLEVSYRGSSRSYWSAEYKSVVNSTTYTRGSFITTVIAENGTYPTNGRHSDGYWYVIGSLVTPTTPISITVPEVLEVGTTFTISWETSTNQEGYKLERSINSGAYIEVYSGANRSYVDTPLANWETIGYRVRAYNGTAYSSYVTSPIRELSTFQDIQENFNGVWTSYVGAWENVNGTWIEIIEIWENVNGTWIKL